MSKVTILTAEQIHYKLKRMAYEIWEKNSNEKEITLIGITGGGATVAHNLTQVLLQISPLKVTLLDLDINKKAPLSQEILIDKKYIKSRSVILIDDVANSGKTLIYALRPILDLEPQKIQIAVLVDRKHKSFPIVPDIIGFSVSTTLQDQIIVNTSDKRLTSAHLE